MNDYKLGFDDGIDFVMSYLEEQIKKAQELMRSGYWDAADDVLEQLISKAKHMENQLEEMKAQVKSQKNIIKQMDRRIMARDR